MLLTEIQALCSAQPGAEEEFKPDWGSYVYKIGGKMFALLSPEHDGSPIVSLKCDPFESELLRGQYEDIIPGYHLNKRHWITVYFDRGSVPPDLIEQLVQASHALVFRSLPKARRDALIS